MDTPRRVGHRSRVERVWYFAYGSNMQRATFGGRRGITPRAALAARAAGWRLVVDKPGLVPVGHGFANLVPDLEASVCGVLYDISGADMAHVELTEGVALGNYRRVAIDTVPLLAGTPPTRAWTLVSDKRDPALRPSPHYMALVIEGAREHALPGEWLAHLAAVATAPDSAEAAATRALLNDVLARLRR